MIAIFNDRDLVYLIKSQSIEEGKMKMPRKPYLDAQAYRKLGEIDGVESRQILLRRPLGAKLWSINQLQSKLAGMRIRYKLEGSSLGRANLEREAGGVKATIDRIVSSFVTDCELVADYKMTKQEFVANWYGHHDNGYVNQYVVTVDLWTGERYYEQF